MFSTGILLLLLYAVAADVCTIRCMRAIFPEWYKAHRKRFVQVYVGVHLLLLALFLYSLPAGTPRPLRAFTFMFFLTAYASKLFFVLAVVIHWLIKLVDTGLRLVAKNPINAKSADQVNANNSAKPEAASKLTRSAFIEKTALALASIPFISLNAGMISGVYDYRVRKVTLRLPNLPKAFHGLQLAQISDIHSGSFYNKAAVSRGVDLLMSLKADLIFFTGDLVNDRASEMRNYQDVFSKVRAPLGVFSVLGNHDYGDYAKWPSIEAKRKNLDDLKKVHHLMGYDLLLNENRVVKVGGESLAILGVENWGSLSRFPKYGRLDLAMRGVEDYPVKLLLSHDPTHWRAKVLPAYKSIDVMFSGHTHGMQMGIRTNSFQWSPVQYVYDEWAGLYNEGAQQLYVNVGYGFLGYPGRIGILPEITLFTLQSS